MGQAFYPEQISNEELLTFLHLLNYEKLQISSINISYTTGFTDKDKANGTSVSIDEIDEN